MEIAGVTGKRVGLVMAGGSRSAISCELQTLVAERRGVHAHVAPEGIRSRVDRRGSLFGLRH